MLQMDWRVGVCWGRTAAGAPQRRSKVVGEQGSNGGNIFRRDTERLSGETDLLDKVAYLGWGEHHESIC